MKNNGHRRIRDDQIDLVSDIHRHSGTGTRGCNFFGTISRLYVPRIRIEGGKEARSANRSPPPSSSSFPFL